MANIISIKYNDPNNDNVVIMQDDGSSTYKLASQLTDEEIAFGTPDAFLETLAEAQKWKRAILSDVLEVKAYEFNWDDGGGLAPYRLDGKTTDFITVLSAAYLAMGAGGFHILDGVTTVWLGLGAFPRNENNMEVFTVAANGTGRVNLSYVASAPIAGEYTLDWTNQKEHYIGIILGSAGTVGHYLCWYPWVNDSFKWLTSDVVKKTWTSRQYREFLGAALTHVKACGDNYFAVHLAIENATAVAELNDDQDPGYVNENAGWPASSTN